MLAVEVGSPDRAIEMYEQVLSVDAGHEGALSELARLRTTAGDVAAAVDAVERLAEQDQDPSKQAQLWVRAGKLLQDSGDRDSAIARYKRALDLDKYASQASEALRGIYAQRGDARGAVEMLLQAIDVADGDSKRAALLGELGTIYRDQLDQPEEAKVAFEEALQLDATSSLAAAGLARIAYAEERYADVIPHFESMEARLSDLPADRAAELCVEAYEAYQVLEDSEKALAALKRTRELLPNDLEYAERYASAVLKSGDASSAERQYERILEQFDHQLEGSEKIASCSPMAKLSSRASTASARSTPPSACSTCARRSRPRFRC